MKQRDFRSSTAGAAVSAAVNKNAKRRICLAHTEVRGTSFRGKRIVENYGDILAFASHCDINPGRIESGVNIPRHRQEKINQAELHTAEMNQSERGNVSCDETFGIAARKSIDEKRPIKIKELISIEPRPIRGT